MLHRDVKPANILLSDADGQERRVFLADFGIARRVDDATGLTATNMTVGTAAYAAPEQLKGEPIDGRADQYSLACTAFHLLTGAQPYVDTNPVVVISKHVNAPPPSIGAYRPELAELDPVFAALWGWVSFPPAKTPPATSNATPARAGISTSGRFQTGGFGFIGTVGAITPNRGWVTSVSGRAGISPA